MRLLNGKELADGILERTRQRIEESGASPTAAWVLVGADPASRLYGELKAKAAARVGMGFRSIVLPAGSDASTVERTVQSLNTDPDVDGIILQLPLPEHLRASTDRLVAAIGPDKDADGTHPANVERFLAGDTDVVVPVFPRAVMELVAASGEPLPGKTAAIVCNSEWFGSVMGEALRRGGVTVEVILQSGLQDRSDTLVRADIVVTACGVPGLVTGDMVKPGATVIDGGIVKLPDGKVVGDVDRVSVEAADGWLSPVPGGVGPVTVACLLDNVARLSLE